MKLFDRFKRSPDFVIGRSDGPYLQRWFLIPRNRWFNVYLHKFVRDDEDRALHDHPWQSLSIVLRGGYYEITPGPDGSDQRRWYRPGSIIFRRAVHRHRVELRRRVVSVAALPGWEIVQNSRIPSWTLFITGPRIRDWGFWCPQGFVHWTDFTDGKDGERVGKGCDQGT